MIFDLLISKMFQKNIEHFIHSLKNIDYSYSSIGFIMI